MKKFLSFLLSLALCCALAACGDGPSMPAVSSDEASDPDTSIPADTSGNSEPGEDAGNGILIAYFAYGENAPLADGVDASASASIQYHGDALTGNTEIVANMIADATSGELFSILTEEQYPDNYNDTIDIGQTEKIANARPEMTSHMEVMIKNAFYGW